MCTRSAKAPFDRPLQGYCETRNEAMENYKFQEIENKHTGSAGKSEIKTKYLGWFISKRTRRNQKVEEIGKGRGQMISSAFVLMMFVETDLPSVQRKTLC